MPNLNEIRPFQIALLAIFVFLAFAAIYIVRVFEVDPLGTKSLKYGEQVLVWGSIDETVFKTIHNQMVDRDKEFDAVVYQYVDEREFDDALINAIAESRSPDLIILKSDSLVKHRAKLWPIPFDAEYEYINGLSKRDLRDNFVDGAEVFALKDGLYAVPFLVDPLVMYWNRDLLATAGLAVPPSTWEALVSRAVPSLTIRDTSRNILQSAVAFGEYRNVENAKDILMTLNMQSGSKMVTENERDYDVELDKPIIEGARPPLDATVEFYTDFSNSNSPSYTWNRVPDSDKNAFLAEELAIYFGKGSEAIDIADKNPNLNFDVAEVPQGESATVKRIAGDFYGLAIPRAAYNPEGAYMAARTMALPQNSGAFAKALGMSSATRRSIAEGDSNPYRAVVLNSALVARGWLDPDPEASSEIFRMMIEDVVSNRLRVSNAVSDAVRRLSFEY